MRFFREIITVVAGLVALVLIAALAGPYFINWDKHRPVIVQTLERATGAKIDVRGSLDLRLLPSPRLRLRNVEITGKQSRALRLGAEALNLELGLTSLLRGQFRFVEAELQRAVIAVSVNDDGGLVLPALPVANSGQIAFEHVALRDARLLIKRPDGRSWLISGLNLEASGQSLEGPFRGNGSFAAGSGKIAYLFNTGTVENGGIRAKFTLEAPFANARGEFDGILKLQAANGTALKPSFEGTAAVFGKAVLPGGVEQEWRAAGPLLVDMRGLRSDAFEFRSGEDDRALSAAGALLAHFSGLSAVDTKNRKARVYLSLAAQQINADAILGADERPELVLQRIVNGLRLLAAGDVPEIAVPVPVDLQLTVAAFTAGRETLSKVALSVVLQPWQPVQIKFSAGAPGSTSIALQGALERGLASRFNGKARFSTRNMRRLQQWLSPGLPNAGRIAAAIPYRSFRFAGPVALSKAGFAARDAAIEAGRSRFNGAIIYTHGNGKERARLFVDLASPALDIDGLGDFSAPASALGALDFEVALDARATRLARVGSGTIDAGKISLRMVRKDGETRLPRLQIMNLGGANVAGEGVFTSRAGKADVSVDAKNLVQLSQVLARVAPSPWTRALVARAAALSPAKIKIALHARSSGAGPLTLKAIELDGTANGTRLQIKSAPDAKHLGAAGSLIVQAGNSAVLLKQLGVPAITLSGIGKGMMEMSWRKAGKASGAAARKARSTRSRVDIKAQIAGTRLAFGGEAAGFLPQPDLQGKLSISSRDVMPLLQTIAFALPSASARAPVDVSGIFAWRGERLSVGSIAGSIAGAKLTGQAVLEPRTLEKNISRHFLSGALRFDRLSLRGLGGLVLGPDPGGGKGWRSAPFQPAAGDFPPGELEIQTGRFDLPSGASGRNARFTLRLSPGALVLDNIAMKAGHTSLQGGLALRSDKAASTVSGNLTFRTPSMGLHGISGGVSGEIEFAATGKSEQELVSGLAGKGSAVVKDLTIAGADPAAMQRVLRATDAEKLELTESGVRAALRKQFAAAPLAFKQKKFAITIAGGTARLETAKSLALPGGTDGELSATFDLRAMKGQARLDLIARKRPKDWNGALPSVSLERVLQPKTSKPANTGTRIVAASFVNGVSARAIVREVARMEALEFDIRERAYFNRRVKSAEFLARRRDELAAYRIEQARLAEEARKKAEEEARKRAADEAKRKAEEEKARLEAERKRKAEEARRREAQERKARQDAKAAAAGKAKVERKAKNQAAERARRALRDAARAGGGSLPARPIISQPPSGGL